MRIRVRDIEEATKELTYDEPTGELNPLLEHGPIHDYEFVGPVAVTVRYYRAGTELFFEGETRGRVAGQCARCLETFEFTHAPRFAVILVPREGKWANEDLADEDEVGFYDGEEVDLTPQIRDRLLLSLPTLPLCRESCRGLCPSCGADLNQQACQCVAPAADPRLAILRGLKLGS